MKKGQNNTNVRNSLFRFYINFSVHLNIVFIPTVDFFQKINENDIEKFIKEHKIVYDVYFKQNDEKKDIIKELIYIFEEKPYILYNMGIKLKIGDQNEISDKVNNFNFYKICYGDNFTSSSYFFPLFLPMYPLSLEQFFYTFLNIHLYYLVQISS